MAFSIFYLLLRMFDASRLSPTLFALTAQFRASVLP